MRRSLWLMLALALAGLILAACAEQGSPADAVARYLKAKVAGNEGELVKLACADWEAQAALDAAPFKGVSAQIEGLTCQDAGQDGDVRLVTCAGTLTIQYRGEDPRQQPLGGETYRVRREDGEWKMCGAERQ